ncbi:MAG TPA: amidohydrolase [Thermoanaerobaculia bacterium]|jgi:5-methylthioadenosine/S-adenosylhomocysteine deaminase|nr:amidohydrolase [Thermoanaerobaculia bacterium]
MLRRRFLPFLLTLFALTVHAAPRRVDIVVTGGTVITMAGPNIENGAVAIDKGDIVAVGRSADIAKRFAGRETIHARGMAVLPGFVNAHTHVPMTLFRGIADDRDLMDWLQHFIFPAEAKNVDRDFVRWGTRLAAAEMIESGTTTFTDMYYFESDVAAEARKAGLRAVAGETMIDFPVADNKTWEAAVAYVRAFVKRWQGDRLITPALAPHAPYTVSRAHLEQIRALATELHAPILIHVAETKNEAAQIKDNSAGLSPAAYLDSIGFLGHDVVAAHGVWLTPEDIKTFAAKRVGVAHCPESNMMLASGVAPVVDMRRAGVAVGLGTDGPAGSNNNLDMVEEAASAARLQKVTRGDPRALSARDVLEMATLGGARVLGMEDRIGTLEAGKRADVIVIDLQQPKSQPVYAVESAIVYAASGSSVVTTICDGKVLMRNRRVLTVDIPAVLAKAKEYRDRVRKSISVTAK